MTTDFLSFDPKKNKTVKVGLFIGNALFKEVQRQHLMRVLDGYGIQETAFNKLPDKKIEFIVLSEQWDGGNKLYSRVTDWEKLGRVMDYGNGKQRFLSRKYMSVKPLF